jgi:hypothetical protein
MVDFVVIKKGSMELVRTDRSNLVTAEASHDGVVFTFKQGIQIYCTDNYMPIHTKDIIKNSCNSFPNANLTIDLANYNKPANVEATKK